MITNYTQNDYKLQQVLQIIPKLLQITTGITNCGVITNCVVAIAILSLMISIMIVDLPWCDASSNPVSFMVNLLENH